MDEMKYLRAQLVRVLVEYFGDDDRRIEHALRVLGCAERILARRPECYVDVLIAAALLHDVGIKVAEERYGHATGKAQEEDGPPVARRLLASIGFPPDRTQIVMDIIGNHHSPSRYDYPELDVLKEADRFVNRNEEA